MRQSIDALATMDTKGDELCFVAEVPNFANGGVTFCPTFSCNDLRHLRL